MKPKTNGTQTSSFGVGKRMNHDSSKFYNSKLYSGNGHKQPLEFIENSILEKNINKVFCKSSKHMTELPDNSVHLMVTSPPYNVGKEYDNNLTLDEYRKLLYDILKETYRVLVPGGRACINIANLGRKPYIPLHSYIIEEMDKIGFLMRGEIIWNKASSASQSFAWGSWMSASNPTLRDVHEYILVFSKGRYDRKRGDKKSTISREEFMEFTKSIWTFPAERASRVNHPAPFPVELPYRLIQLYTFENDIVLDPFLGSGTACIASLKTNRQYVGYDIDKKYCEIAEKRIEEFKMRLPSLFPSTIALTN